MKNKFLATVVLILSALLLLSSCHKEPHGRAVYTDPDANLTVHFLDVGQADCTLLVHAGMAMLIDGGNVEDSSLVAAYLKERGIDYLDYMVCTHAHEDHVGGLSGALSVCKVGRVYSPVEDYDSKAFRDFEKYVEAQGAALTIPAPGESFFFGNAYVEILAPQREDYGDTNNTSIVLKVSHGAISFLFTGDAERESEADMLEAGCDLSATVLKVGHHGSNTSTSYPFLREVMPRYAVISVGEDNAYDHPSDDTLSRLRDADVTVYRSDMQGNIIAVSDGENVSISTEKNSNALTNPTETDGSGQNGMIAEPAYYIGNLRSLKLHTPDCASLPGAQNQTLFDTREAAFAEGYTPCANCMTP